MESRFNAPLWAFVLALGALVPLFFSIDWWPPAGVFLFAAFVFCIIGIVQGRVGGSVIVLLILFFTGPFRTFILPFMHAAEHGHDQEQQSTTAQLSGGESVTPTPAANSAEGVAASQQAAVRKYPDLAVKDSPLNQAFVARYTRWKQQDDPRLQQVNWPEVLADDCRNHP